MVLRSAWIPAPPPESEPATVSTRGGVPDMSLSVSGFRWPVATPSAWGPLSSVAPATPGAAQRRGRLPARAAQRKGPLSAGPAQRKEQVVLSNRQSDGAPGVPDASIV